jgi:hypothetical protein
MPWPRTCGHWAIAMGNSSAVCSHANAGPTVSTGRIGRECGVGLTFKFCSYSPAGPAPAMTSHVLMSRLHHSMGIRPR